MSKPAPQRVTGSATVVEPRTPTVRPAQAMAHVLRFRRPDADLLARVEVDCRTLGIPTYAELKGPYWQTYNAYLNAQDWSKANAARDRFWAALSQEFGISAERIQAFRKNDPAYSHWLGCRENLYESAAYLMGLYVARREYPKLGGGVL